MTDATVAAAMSELAATQKHIDTWPAIQIGTPAPTGFVARYGHVEYAKVMRKPPQWRAAVLSRSACEVDSSHSRALTFDHCHEHRWVRAIVCLSCNVRLGQLDAARKLPGVTITLGNSGFGRVAAMCPGGWDNRDKFLPPDPEFLSVLATAKEKREAQRKRRQLGIPELVLRRPGERAHVRYHNTTVCGKSADDAPLAPRDVPVCQLCAKQEPEALQYAFSVAHYD